MTTLPAVYEGNTFSVVLHRYSDPERLNAARNAAIYLGRSDRENVKRPLIIIKAGHVPEIFRGEHAEFEFIDVSKEVYDHLITYTTRTMRVAGGNRALRSNAFTMPSDYTKNPTLVRDKVEASMANYHDLLDAGESKQVARAAMPVNAKMNPFVFQFNFLTLMQSLFAQRIWDAGAQGNTVKVVRGMYELVYSIDPDLWETAFEYYGPPAIEWREVREKIKRGVTVEDVYRSLEDEFNDGTIDPKERLDEYLRREFGSKKSMWS